MNRTWNWSRVKGQDQSSSLSLYPVRNITKHLQEVPQLTAAAACAHSQTLTSASSRLLHIQLRRQKKHQIRVLKVWNASSIIMAGVRQKPGPLVRKPERFKRRWRGLCSNRLISQHEAGQADGVPLPKKTYGVQLNGSSLSGTASFSLSSVWAGGGGLDRAGTLPPFTPRCCSKVCLPPKNVSKPSSS